MATQIMETDEVAAEKPSAIEEEIIQQIEYYFGNYNLCKDKFLREQLKLDDGWVPLETLVKFNRLKRLSTNFSEIAAALKKSPKQLLEVNEECTKIRRREPLPKGYGERQLDRRTLYVEGFRQDNTLDELLQFFREQNVENIYMHYNDRQFTGSVFATFQTREAAKAFFETKGINFNGVPLLKEWKQDYLKKKADDSKRMNLILKLFSTELIPKTDEVDNEGPSTLEQEIIWTLEHYFGNYHLSTHKTLRERLQLDDGWYPLETLVKLNRLKRLSTNFSVIAGALKKSPKQLLEVNAECTKIRRRKPIPKSYFNKRKLDKRTLFVKGFRKDTTLYELLEFFRKYKVENILMDKHSLQHDKQFTGSVFATFETKKAAARFFRTEGINYNGVQLLKQWKKDCRKKKDGDSKSMKKARGKKTADDKDKQVAVTDIEYIPGCLLKLTGLKGGIREKDIKKVFYRLGKLAYVDYTRGNPSAVIRFKRGAAGSVLEKLPEEEGVRKAEIKSSKVDVTLLEGEEETNYWKNIFKSRAQLRQRRIGGNKGSFKKREGNKDNNDESIEPSSKKVKTEDSEESSEDSEESSEDSDMMDTSEDESFEPPSKKVKTEDSEGNKESAKMETSGGGENLGGSN